MLNSEGLLTHRLDTVCGWKLKQETAKMGRTEKEQDVNQEIMALIEKVKACNDRLSTLPFRLQENSKDPMTLLDQQPPLR